MNSKTKKGLGIAGNIVLWLFVAFAVVITVLVFAANANSDGVPSIGGKSPISVLTDSMSPTFKAGDLIICRMLTDQEKANVEVDEVITYYVDLNNDGIDEINSHRVVDKYEESGYVYYITQGDNEDTNPVPDENPVAYYDVICVYTGTRIPGLGGFLSFLQTQLGFLLIIVLPLVLFFLYELYRFFTVLNDVRGNKKGVISAADEEEIKRRAVEEYLRSQDAAPTDADRTAKTPDNAPATDAGKPSDNAPATDTENPADNTPATDAEKPEDAGKNVGN